MEHRSIAQTRQSLCRTSSTSVCSSNRQRLALVMPRSDLVRTEKSTATANHDLTNHSSQPKFARSARFPHPIYLDHPLPMPVPRRRSTVHPDRPHSRLLLLWMYRHGDRRSCRVRPGKQYVEYLFEVQSPNRIDNDTAFPFAVFIIYGAHWGSLAYNQDPLHGISSAFEAEGGATGAVYNSSQVFHNITMYVALRPLRDCPNNNSIADPQ
jgi:hypothetical protein